MTTQINSEKPIQVDGINQVEKYKAKSIKIFNIIDLTKARKKAKEEQSRKTIVFKVKKTKVSKNYIEEPITIGQDSILKAQEGSIQQFLNECHPEVRQFINENHPTSFTAKCGQLIVTTRNKVRVIITTIGKFQKKVSIIDRHKNILFNNITTMVFKPIKHEQYN